MLRQNGCCYADNIIKCIAMNKHFRIFLPNFTEIYPSGYNRITWQYSETLVDIKGTAQY